jgi:hypothetical protein
LDNYKNNSSWDGNEIRLITETELFLKKPDIMKKVTHKLDELKIAIIDRVKKDGRTYPDGTDLIKGQIARGENHNGFPFISLDIPQKFSKTEMFTFRTLFWWGHYLGFSLILKGTDLVNYTEKLSEKKDSDYLKDVCFATTVNLWEWENNPNAFQPVFGSSSEFIHKTINEIDYIKLIQFFPLDDSSFHFLDWKHSGLTFFENMMKIIKD